MKRKKARERLKTDGEMLKSHRSRLGGASTRQICNNSNIKINNNNYKLQPVE